MAEEQSRGIFAWLQDNARILLSIALVLFLLFAVYSYSQRTKPTQSIVEDNTTSEEVVPADENADTADVVFDDTQDTIVDNTTAQEITETAAMEETIPAAAEPVIEHVDGAISVSAVAGDSLTRLARRAAAEYMSGNDITLTAEQKVYVEDYVQKSVARQAVTPGTTVSFANDTIATAIQGAQALTDSQIANLTKYAQRVSSL